MENTLGNIKLEVNYKIIEILELKICTEPNKHGTAEIKCIVDESSLNDVIKTQQDEIKIKDNETLIFSGVIDKVKLKHAQGIHYITINALTHSIKLDIKKKRRSFQNKVGAYTKIFDTVIKEDYGGDYLDNLTKGSLQNRVILQYDESNWEFLIRIVSHKGGVVIPDLLGDTPRVYIGIPNRESKVSKEYNYNMEKDIIQFDITKQNFTEKTMLDHVVLYLKMDEYCEIGDDINHNGKNLTIFKREIISKKSMIEKHYYMKLRTGIYNNFFKNPDFTGLSIDGKIIAVSGDKIKVHLTIDETQPIEEANWFTLSTFYTTEGQTGLYLMPKEGESVKLYFPESDENEGFIRLINRKDGGSNTKAKDVDKKYLGNEYGKEIKLSPNEVKITTSNGGLMEIKMTDKYGIEMKSNKEMKIRSDGDITFKSNKTSMSAKESICTNVNFSSETLDGISHFKAEKITVNGTTKS